MATRSKLDEVLPRDAHTLLADAGHDAHSVTDEGLGGGPDPKVIAACLNENRILVTLDLDFADIRALSTVKSSRDLGSSPNDAERREHRLRVTRRAYSSCYGAD
jgi:Domain of unknown function (DUF5615)